MGVDLSGRPSLASGSWRCCLRMAVAHGWDPEGTLPPDHWRADEEWSGRSVSQGASWPFLDLVSEPFRTRRVARAT
jgi:hypothetical protein